MALFKEILFHDIEPSLRDFAVQPKTFDENHQILQKYYHNGGPMKTHSYLSFVFSPMKYHNENLYSSVSQKYSLLKHALNNKFSSTKPDDYLDSFSRAQKIYFAFGRLAYNYRYKKAIIRNQEDMMMLPISKNEKDVIVVYEDNNKYLFRHSEILKICRTSLCHASENDLDYIEPRPMKNPYTNIPFNKASLFHMYDSIIRKYHKVQLLFQTFFLCNFNLKELWNKHSPLIIDLTIKDYLNNATIKTLTRLTFVMLENIESHSDIDFKFTISPGFDRKLLTSVMRPYIELFLQSFHNHNDFYSNRCLEELKYKLKVLYTKHPNFGRKKMIFIKSNKKHNSDNNIKAKSVLCTEHSDFTHSTSLENFEESHYYTGFVDDIDFRIDDPYFARQRRERIIREQQQQQQDTNFTRRRNNNNNNQRNNSPQTQPVDVNSQQNNSDAYSSDDDFDSFLTRYRHITRYHQEEPTATYNDEDEEDNIDTSDISITTTITSSGEDYPQNDVNVSTNLNINDTDNSASNEEEDLFDIETVDLSEPNNASENDDENKTNNELEDGEISTDDPPPHIQELQNLSTQVRGLLNDDNILVIDGRQRLLSLLSQIDNLNIT